MIAVEFETHVKNGKITIPAQYRKMAEGDLRIILLKNELPIDISLPTPTRISALQQLLKDIQAKNIFKDIDDPVQWQRDIRNEWA